MEFMLRRVLVGDNERVLLIRKMRFADILAPGEYWIFTLGQNIALERVNVKGLVFASEWGDYIVKERPELAARYFTVIDTADSQVAVVSVDGKLARVIGPGKRMMFWRGVAEIAFELIDARQAPEVPAALVAPLARLGAQSGATFAAVDEGKRALVYIDGRLFGELGAGVYGF